jgi:GT2 family glycosyltransferase
MQCERIADGWSASIIIPAHNEANALPGLLSALLDQDVRGHRLQIVVAVNGSSDLSGSVARGFRQEFGAIGHQLVVVEIETASKAAALNEGERHATSFPRIYLDADIEISPDAIRRTIEVLSSTTKPRLAAPRVEVAENSSAFGRRYGRVWSRLPYVRSHVPGVGFYAVNAPGRSRWWRFPTRVGADDKYVRLHFDLDEVVVIDDVSFTIYLPERVNELLRVRARWNDLNRQIARNCPGLNRRDRSRWVSSARFLAATPSLWLDIPAFLVVWIAGRWLSLFSFVGSKERWFRADSSPPRRRLHVASPATTAGQPAWSEPVEALASKAPPRRSVHAVIVTYNSMTTVVRCLDRILESRGLDELKITVVDNASLDGGPAVVRSKYPEIEVMANERNIGFGSAVNQAVSNTHNGWIAIINPDVEVHRDTIARSVDHLVSKPDVGSCGVRAVRSDGRVNDRSFFTRPSGWSEVALALGTHRFARSSKLLNPEQHLAYRQSDRPVGVDIVAGCFNVLDAQLFHHLGGYDERYFLCGEDFDLGVRAIEAGAAPEIVPLPPIIHHSGGSFATSIDARVASLRGRAEFERRWWPRRRSMFGQAVRASSVFCRFLVERARSNRQGEFAELWARRAEWMVPVVG